MHYYVLRRVKSNTQRFFIDRNRYIPLGYNPIRSTDKHVYDSYSCYVKHGMEISLQISRASWEISLLMVRSLPGVYYFE